MFSLGFAIAILGGGLAAGLAAYGSSVGVGLAGEMAGGVISEDPEKFGSMLILQALPATQSIYGLVVDIITGGCSSPSTDHLTSTNLVFRGNLSTSASASVVPSTGSYKLGLNSSTISPFLNKSMKID